MRNVSAAFIALLVSATIAHSETPTQKWNRISAEMDYLSTHEGFLYWFGALSYQSQACAIAFPEAGIDFFARRAGVTKEEVAKQGLGSPFAEGYRDAMLAAKQDGLNQACERARATVEKMRENGLD